MSAIVLGWALRTPLGATVDEVVTGVLAGTRCEGFARGAADDSRHVRFLPRLPLLALSAAREATRAAGIEGGDRVGVFAGVGGLRIEWSELAPALCDQRDDGVGAWARGLSRMHPFWMLRNLSNNGHALLAADLSARGEGMTFGGGTAGAQAIASAERALATETIDIAVVVAYDTLLAPELGYDNLAASEAVAALVLGRAGRGLVRIRAASAADGEPDEPRADTLARVSARVERGDAAHLVPPHAPLGAVGAATSLVQTIVFGELLRRGELAARSALCLATSAPGLAAAVCVEALP